jgi:hypothetical protein
VLLQVRRRRGRERGAPDCVMEANWLAGA